MEAGEKVIHCTRRRSGYKSSPLQTPSVDPIRLSVHQSNFPVMERLFSQLVTVVFLTHALESQSNNSEIPQDRKISLKPGFL